jgi:predicted GH43/DUF377 family glycosyl hydrolase
MTLQLSILITVIALACALIAFACLSLAKKRKGEETRVQLSRAPINPIIQPHIHRPWELYGTFNPAAIMDDDGVVHLFYRAVGEDGISRIGHASSIDGIHFDTRSMYPVYEPRPGYGLPEENDTDLGKPKQYDPLVFTSGGGWGGIEDPRTVRIGSRVYMIFLAFAGWDDMRIAVTSITMDDLRKHKWKWRKAAFLSPPKSRNKNWVLFPEKINGKYAILHGISPRIMIDYLDSVDGFSGIKPIKSCKDHGGYGYSDRARAKFWDNRVRGAGTPPIKTDLGWLVLYHAIDKREPNRYKVGAMILDFKDPTNVLYRSPAPILEPDMDYENHSKPGVVYASGAVVKNGNLLVYYGGGDRHVCVAEVPLKSLLEWLVEYGKI